MIYHEGQAVLYKPHCLSGWAEKWKPIYKTETTVSAWQRCPICDGAGKIPTDGTATFKACDVCAGKKIISTVTGLPPAY